MGDERRFRNMSVSEELYQKLDRLRLRKAKQLSLTSLSWNEFLSMVEESIRESLKEGTGTK